MRLWPCIFGLTLADKVPLINYEIQGEIRGLDKCDLQQLEKPKYAERWSCDSPIINGKVSRKTNCEIVCLDGHDKIEGEKSGFLSVTLSSLVIAIVFIKRTIHNLESKVRFGPNMIATLATKGTKYVCNHPFKADHI